MAEVYDGPARLGFMERAGPHGGGRDHRAQRAPRGQPARPPGPAAGHRGRRRTRSPRSTRCPSSPWPPPWPRAPPSSPTWASCGSRRWTAWPPWPTWSRPSGPGPRVEGDTLVDHRPRRSAARRPLRQPGGPPHGHGRRRGRPGRGAGGAQPAHRLPGRRDQLPRLRRRPAPPDRGGAASRGRCSSPSTDRPGRASRPSPPRWPARLGLDRLDTGAMYRAVAALALARGRGPRRHRRRGRAGRGGHHRGRAPRSSSTAAT